MELLGRKQSDSATLPGSPPRATEVLNKKRALTVEMIYKLHKDWGHSGRLPGRPYHLAEAERVNG